MTERRNEYLFKTITTMELLLKRETFTEKSTIGSLSIDGKFECFILEDKCRDLFQTMSLELIQKNKIHGVTCIPYGRYEVVINMSNRFEVLMPLLLDVKGYEGIRIHKGNSDVDTLGCLLPGMVKRIDRVTNSTYAYGQLFEKMKAAKKIFITITK